MNRRKFIHTATLSSVAISSSSLFAQEKKEAVTFTMQSTDINGKPLKLTDFIGLTVLVSFFTSGCNLCTRDLKLMREFYVGNANRKFVLLAINIDQDKRDFDTYNQLVSLAIPKEQRFPTVWRNAPGHKDNFGTIVKQPTHFVLNAQNQFIFKREGTFLPDDWDNLWLSLS
ncbi:MULTISPECIES: redoxin domain-containing protein [unclassified Undibacterium]|nr:MULTISPECIES: redoxin domain-containing protein [unclassified Undibacterium]MEB0229766.1 redoxin domain-containing protein [Undibacterium sp. 10I3]MEB0259265.1 redoxin domain-containing protein [Undibacterium sp. 5I1]